MASLVACLLLVLEPFVNYFMGIVYVTLGLEDQECHFLTK